MRARIDSNKRYFFVFCALLSLVGGGVTSVFLSTYGAMHHDLRSRVAQAVPDPAPTLPPPRD